MICDRLFVFSCRIATWILVSVALTMANKASARDNQALPAYSGLYVATLPLIDSRRAMPEDVYRRNEIEGIYIRLVWKTIEPSPSAYDWSTLDRELSLAMKYRKRISLSVITGGYTPTWLKHQGASMSRFVVTHGDKNRACLAIDLGWPWDSHYQAAYIGAVNALAAHLRTLPGAYDAVRIVKITGISQFTEELRLPTTGNRPQNICQDDAISTWRAAGYRPRLVVDAWNKMAAGVAAAFPDKLLAQDVLDRNDFPPIGNRGELEARSTVKNDIIRSGIEKFGPRFAIQWNGLNSGGKLPEVVLDAGRRGAKIGWQSNAFRGLQGAGCNAERKGPAVPCDMKGYRAILERGIATGAQYIEVWPNDVLQFPAAIASAQAELSTPTPQSRKH